MGAHKHNPVALAAAARGPRPIQGEYQYMAGLQVRIEPNAAKKAEMQAEYDRQKAEGIPEENMHITFDLTPDDQDVVGYFEVMQGRPSLLTQQMPTARMRVAEAFRVPLVEIMGRADLAFNGGKSPLEA